MLAVPDCSQPRGSPQRGHRAGATWGTGGPGEPRACPESHSRRDMSSDSTPSPLPPLGAKPLLQLAFPIYNFRNWRCVLAGVGTGRIWSRAWPAVRVR